MTTLCENHLSIFCKDKDVLYEIRNAVFSLEHDGKEIPNFNLLVPVPGYEPLPNSEAAWRGFDLLKEEQNRPVSSRHHQYYFSPWDNYLSGVGFSNLIDKNNWTIGEATEYLKTNHRLQDDLHIDLVLGERYFNISQACGMRWTDWANTHWGCHFNVEPDNCGELQINPNGLEIYFATENTPPLVWFDSLCKAFPDIWFELQYFEPEHRIAGTTSSDGKGGVIRDDIEDSTEVQDFAGQIFGVCFDDA